MSQPGRDVRGRRTDPSAELKHAITAGEISLDEPAFGALEYAPEELGPRIWPDEMRVGPERDTEMTNTTAREWLDKSYGNSGHQPPGNARAKLGDPVLSIPAP
jgi:hypothetical protein